ncbi:histone deacetylase [Roseivirga sp. E12]|uniref:histone deacetylase family protein n=1 Tax=Roseivirga sp. E12 TaxID=2819237 RepID=UPI001ABC4846|nr:histone deacetylase [Roseivirga sp. E12]MBO3696934.1 histone deacetylase [Roseivirga sp. E12]
MLKIAWSEIYAHPLPKNHRFPMEKYNLLPEQLLYEGTVNSDNFFAPTPLSEAKVIRTHDDQYWQKLKNQDLTRQEERRTGFPLSSELVSREIVIMNGSVQCALYALNDGIAMNVAGGTHHAFTDRGEGFCLLNDIAIASHHLLDNGLASKILVVDLDVHQGNGTAEIFAKDDRVFTFSMHGQSNYPMHKEVSDLDVGLVDGTDDETYLKLLDRHLNEVFDDFQPDFVCFQSGVDVLATDKLGRLGMTLDGCKKRDSMVLELCHRNQIPVMACMGGGYSEKIAHIVEAHANTYRLAQGIYF